MAMINTKVYVFSGAFNTIEEACSYSEPQWEPVLDETASDEEYERWEDSKPTFQLKTNIDSCLDEDFIETVNLCYEYLENLKFSASDIDIDITNVREKSAGNNVFVLVYERSLGGFPLKKEPQSSTQLSYCGVYKCVL